MHTKHKGNIAYSSVVLELQKHEFNVFAEIGDYSKIDLIAEKSGILKKIQIKYSGSNEEKVLLRLQKSGPNGYRYTYSEKDVDWFAIYNPFNEKIVWISSNEACKKESGFSIRMNQPKNNQKTGINFIEEYGIDRFLRDFTQDIVPLENDEDKVQTTTLKDGSGN